ncbi:MAG: hypothetical protein WCJ31_15165 [Planctomycetia bacterium]|jgi:hypothetical protein
MPTQAEIDALTQELLSAASSPAEVSNDNGTVRARKVGEIIEAIRFAASVQASRSAGRGIRLTTLQPAGAVLGASDIASMNPADLAWQQRRFN